MSTVCVCVTQSAVNEYVCQPVGHSLSQQANHSATQPLSHSLSHSNSQPLPAAAWAKGTHGPKGTLAATLHLESQTVQIVVQLLNELSGSEAAVLLAEYPAIGHQRCWGACEWCFG